MLRKFKSLKNKIKISVVALVVVIVCLTVFMITSHIVINKKLDILNEKINTNCNINQNLQK